MDAPTTGAVPPPTATAGLPTVNGGSSPKVERKGPAQPIPLSPSRHPYHHVVAATASPSRLQSQSPRLHSPASSEIFERNVQESIPTFGGELTPAHIPQHVMTEDAIPPALEASAQAITSEELNPDEVEIVTATAHQPAAASVLDASANTADLPSLHSPTQTSHPPALHSHTSESCDGSPSLQSSGFLPGNGDDETASNYAQLDPNDVRRLSFISFKDIVQTEHQQAAAAVPQHLGESGSRDNLHIGSLPAVVSGSALPERAASPALRSPRAPPIGAAQTVSSSGIATSPGAGTSFSATDLSPVRSVSTSAAAGAAQQHGELTIETLGQALRKTASRDLGGVRSAGMSPIHTETPRSRTNT